MFDLFFKENYICDTWFKMHFLELPVRPSGGSGSDPLELDDRRTSETNFVVEEDMRSDITDITTVTNCDNSAERKGSSVSCSNVDTMSKPKK